MPHFVSWIRGIHSFARKMYPEELYEIRVKGRRNVQRMRTIVQKFDYLKADEDRINRLRKRVACVQLGKSKRKPTTRNRYGIKDVERQTLARKKARLEVQARAIGVKETVEAAIDFLSQLCK